jgi:hypothetical protein
MCFFPTKNKSWFNLAKSIWSKVLIWGSAKTPGQYRSGTMLSGSIDHVLEVLNDD